MHEVRVHGVRAHKVGEHAVRCVSPDGASPSRITNEKIALSSSSGTRLARGCRMCSSDQWYNRQGRPAGVARRSRG